MSENEQTLFAIGSGSDWDDNAGDPNIAPGALVLVGERCTRPCFDERTPIGTICRVVEDKGWPRRGVSVRPIIVDETACSTGPDIVFARDCVCLRTSDGRPTECGKLLDYLTLYPCTSGLEAEYGQRANLDGKTAFTALRWAVRVGLIAWYEAIDGVGVRPIAEKIKSLQWQHVMSNIAKTTQPSQSKAEREIQAYVKKDLELSKQLEAYHQTAQPSCTGIDAVTPSGQPLQHKTAKAEPKIDGPVFQRVVTAVFAELEAQKMTQRVLCPGAMPFNFSFDARENFDAQEPPPNITFGCRGISEAKERANEALAQLDGPRINSGYAYKVMCIRTLDWLYEELQRSKYTGPRPNDVVRARAMIALAEHRGHLADDDRNIIEDWACARGHDEASVDSSRSLEWGAAQRGWQWLSNFQKTNAVYDERTLQACREQRSWIEAQTSLGGEVGRRGRQEGEEKCPAGELRRWMCKPMGQNVLSKKGRK